MKAEHQWCRSSCYNSKNQIIRHHLYNVYCPTHTWYMYTWSSAHISFHAIIRCCYWITKYTFNPCTDHIWPQKTPRWPPIKNWPKDLAKDLFTQVSNNVNKKLFSAYFNNCLKWPLDELNTNIHCSPPHKMIIAYRKILDKIFFILNR